MSNLCALIVSVITAAAVMGPVVRAQRPERQQEVTVPGLDVSLKAGWQLQFHDGCRFAVPGSWHIDADGNLAVAPDGSNVSIRLFRIENWSAHKGRIKAAFGRVNVIHEDSERRLWFELGDPPRVQHYIDVSKGLSVCSGLLEIRGPKTPEAEETTRRIAESIGPAPARWPPHRVSSTTGSIALSVLMITVAGMAVTALVAWLLTFGGLLHLREDAVDRTDSGGRRRLGCVYGRRFPCALLVCSCATR